MKKQFLVVGMVVFLCLFAAAAWAITHPSFAIAQLQDYVVRKTGRTLLVNGGAKLELFPTLSVRLDDISISSPPGMNGNFLTVDHANIPIVVSDLFRRKIKIRELTLNNPRSNFLIDAASHANWAPDQGEADSGKSDKTDKSKEPLRLFVENGAANFLDERSGQAFAFENASGEIAVGADDELDISGTAAINSQFATLDAHFNSLRRVNEDGSPADISVKAPALDLTFSGRLGTRNALSLVGMLEATSPDVRVLSKWLGSEIGGKSGLKNFTLNGALDSMGAVFGLRNATLGLDGMLGKGELELDLTKKTPSISATLSTDLLNLDPYLSTKKEVAANTDSWPVTPMGVDGLKGVNASLSLSAFKIEWNEAEWGPVDMTGSLKDSVLEAGFENGTLYGGKANARVTFNGAQDVPTLRIDFDGNNLVGEKFFAQALNVDWLAGVTALKSSLTATGHNQQEMMASLKGSFAIQIAQGKFIGLDIMDRISKVGSAVLAGWSDAAESLTDFDEATASFLIQDGIAKSTDVKITTPLVSVVGEGEVDMLRRALDFKFDPKLVTGENQATDLPVKITVKGPWNRPKIYPDVAGILENPEAAYKSLKDLGLPEVSEKDVKKVEKKGKKLLKKLFGN